MARDLAVAARLGWRAARRRLSLGATTDREQANDLRQSLEAWIAGLPPGVVASHQFIELPATRPPWTDTGLRVTAGQSVTWFAAGRVFLSRPLEIWVEPSFQLWGRVGVTGTIFRGTRATHTFSSGVAGTLWLASYFPGEWSDPNGTVAVPAGAYDKVSGGMSVLVVAWPPGIDVAHVLDRYGAGAAAPGALRAEALRLAGIVQAPQGWEYLWYLGPGEIFDTRQAPTGGPSIRCHTHGDVGILRREAAWSLEPDTELRWSWRVDELPTDLREDSLPSHDYVSIAIEFDDGQDLTYYWSAALPVATVYRCPLPAWHDKETHVVVRSGTAELGRWLDERRNVHADYQEFIGGHAQAIVRVWLIANSLFQRGHGRCEYARITLAGPSGELDVL